MLPPRSHAGISLRKWKHGPGLKVTGVEARDAAHRAGLRVGDRIVACSGHALGDADAFVRQIERASSSELEERLTLLLLPRAGGAEAQPAIAEAGVAIS